jgi:predicted helicase
MPTLDLRANHAPVREYYKSLQQYSLLAAKHEGAVSEAFATLLRQCGKKFHWTLVTQFDIKRPKAHPLRVDGALLDPWSLVHGYWEAKDEQDDLAVEVKKKIAAGYPTDNIIFQAPPRAILYQDGKKVADEDITKPEALVDIIKAFFGYQPPEFDQWERAVEEFKDKVPQLAGALEDLIAKERKYAHFAAAFDRFAQVCRTSLNPQLTAEAVEKMLVQHILTERIFRTVFNNPDFVRRNAIAVEIEQVVDKLTQRSFNREKFLGGLDRFYGAIEATAATIHEFSDKQAFLNRVYESFFQGFDEKTADTHGIVYTPQPIVRFIINSVDEILKKEFGKSLGDRGVHVLDPFVGTGNFILSVMRHIPKTQLPQKYGSELHANEVMLLPYYIASMNIEHEYAELAGTYAPFEGLCLVDTFELAEAAQGSFSVMTEKNTRRVEAQKKAPIFVIVGNPPYNAWQIDENDGNKNRKYKVIDKRVTDTYAAASQARLLNSLADPYVKAFRWASDRLGEAGILAYVSNSSYVTQVAFDGMRQHLEQDFDAIYVLDLGGNVRKNPKLSGTTHNVFGIQVGVAIGLFVRRKLKPGAKRKVVIHYARTGEDWRKEDKYRFLDDGGSSAKVEWQTITPDERHTWITEGLRPEFATFLPLSGEAKQGREPEAIFTLISNGLKSQRDPTVYNFSEEAVAASVSKFVQSYRAELRRWVEAGCPSDLDSFVDTSALKWSRNLKRHFERKAPLTFSEENVRVAQYRPFTTQHLYFARIVIDEVGQLFNLFPSAGDKNVAIWLKTGSEWPMFALTVASVADLLPQGGSRLLALDRFDDDGGRHDNITDWARDKFRNHYGDKQITKRAILHYVYAVLHHPEYRSRYTEDLKRELPRIPFAGDFWAFAKAGEKLANLHLDFEAQPEYPLRRVEDKEQALDLRVEKMKLSRDKSEIVYNDFLTLVGIPAEAFEYRLGNRSGLEWVIDQYQVSKDPRSGILNDPNRPDDPEYIIRLVGQVIHVSVETMKIVKTLPQRRSWASQRQLP